MQTHFKDPCIHCGVTMEAMKPGACEGDPKKAVPLAYAVVPTTRQDGVEHYRVRFSDGRIVDIHQHASYHAPYYHFGRLDELIQPPRFDEKLRGSRYSEVIAHENVTRNCRNGQPRQ